MVLMVLAAWPAAVAEAADDAGVSLATVPAQSTITITFRATVNDPVSAGADNISNQATLGGDDLASVSTDDPDAGGATDPTLTPLDAVPDLTIAKSDGGGTASPGGTIVYQLDYSNVGHQGATGVTLTETVPANTTFNPGSSTAGWSCVPDNTAGSTCSLVVGLVAGGGAAGSADFAVTVVDPVPAGVEQVSNTASISDDGGNGSDPNPGDNSAGDTTPVDAAPDLALSKDDGGASVAPGGTVAYTLDYANNGDQEATGVELSETVPANTTFNSGASTAGWSCLPDGNPGAACTLAVGAVAGGGAGGSATFAVDVDAAVPAGLDQVSNTATISDDGANGSDPTPADNSDSDTTPVNAAPDLGIDKDDGGSSAVPGGTVSYVLGFGNNGSQGATGVELSETVPAGTSFNAGTSTAGWSCLPDASAGSTCTLVVGSLAAGASDTATFAVDVDDPVAAGVTQISNTASIDDDGSNGADPVPGDNSAGDTTPVNAAPDLVLDKDDGGAAPLPGGTVSYTLSVTNAGNQGATGVVITDTVPTATTFNAGASTAGWSCVPDANAGSTCTLSLGALAGGGGSAAVFFVVDVDDPLPGGVSELSNTASVADDGANGVDANPADNEDTELTSLDSDPPTVVAVNTIADTGDGQLDQCETATVPVSALAVTFSEPLFDPAGDTDPDDATNPDNFLVVQPGADRVFQTSACGSVLGDDVQVVPSAVSNDADPVTPTATVFVALRTPAQHRLLVCGSTSITDLAGNPLDGDANGTGGDDFLLDFRADPRNLFANGHLDCDLAGWTRTSTNPAEIVHDAMDHEAAPGSGSVQITNLTASTDFQLSQCVAAGPGMLRRSFSLRLQADPGVLVSFERRCTFYPQGACGGGVIGERVEALLADDTGGTWVGFASEFAAPEGTASARCSFGFSTPAAEDFTAWLDAVTLVQYVIFTDGFESGSTSAWSETVGN